MTRTYKHLTDGQPATVWNQTENYEKRTKKWQIRKIQDSLETSQENNANNLLADISRNTHSRDFSQLVNPFTAVE